MRPEIKNDKLTLKNVPLSVSNDAFVQMLEDQGVVLKSTVKFGYIRDENGGLTTFKSGDRFVYVEPFDPPLPRNQTVSMFPCIVFHHGKSSACASCGIIGHKVGDEQCEARLKNDMQIYTFKSYKHPLSNHYPFTLRIDDQDFKSIEHAYFWRMAMEMGKTDLAETIKKSKHAGEAKRIGKEIAPDEERWKWEIENMDVMSKLLKMKTEQCEAFRNTLLEQQGTILAEATPSKIWASGLSPYVTSHTNPEYWPGKNMLGAMLMDLTQELLTRKQQVNNNDTKASFAEPEIVVNYQHDPEIEQADNGTDQNNVPVPENLSVLVTENQPVEHVSRAKERTSPEKRPQRSFSTPRRRTSTSRNHNKNKIEPITPLTIDIRTALQKKRKILASSPTESDVDKMKQTKVSGHEIT